MYCAKMMKPLTQFMQNHHLISNHIVISYFHVMLCALHSLLCKPNTYTNTYTNTNINTNITIQILTSIHVLPIYPTIYQS